MFNFFPSKIPETIFLFTVIFLSAGCLGQQRRQPFLWQEEPPDIQDLTWEILDYQNKDQGKTIPQWVNFYLEGVNSSIEKIENLAEFQDYYVFIGTNTGTNFGALRQWNTAFSPELDFARLAAMRIEKRFLNAAITYPDDEYGGYFIALIRAASDAQWTGAVKKDDFWLYRSTFDAEDPGESRENYDFLILVAVEKNLLAEQIRHLLANVNSAEPLSRYQRNAVSRVQEKFFEGF